MKRSLFTSFFLLVVSSIILSQNKLLSIEDVVINSYTKLRPNNLNQLSWIPNTNNYAWVDGTRDKTTLLSSSVKSTLVDTLLKISQLNSLSEKLISQPMKSFPSIEWISPNKFNYWNANKYFSYNLDKKSIQEIISIPDIADNKNVAPNKQYVAFTIANNLHLAIPGNTDLAITTDPDTNIVNGQIVHRNEFGIDKGIFWSPKNNYIAYYRMDQTMVTDYPLVDLIYTPARLKNIKYPMAGQSSHHVTIGVYNLKNNQTIWLNTGEPLDQYLTNVSWSPDEKYIYIAHLNRDQNNLQWKQYDVDSGKFVKNIV
jgi:dipeptidyl-peptidase-4